MSPSDAGTLRAYGIAVVTRLMAVLRAARTYAVGNAALTSQVEQLLAALAPVLDAHGHARLLLLDGDLHLNGARLPVQAATLRFLDQLRQELSARGIAGFEFESGLEAAELGAFAHALLAAGETGEALRAALAGPAFSHVRVAVQAVSPREAAQAAGGPPALSEALRAYDRALAAASAMLDPGSLDRGVELRRVKRLVEPLVDAALAGGGATAGLAGASPGEPAWAHAVHTCLVAVAVGRHLGLDRRGLSDAGVAALLHDVGQPLVAAGLGPDPARWTDAERAAAARHTFAGVRRIAGSTTLNPTSLAAMRAALEHHLDAGAGRPVAALSRLVAIADAFTTLLARAGGDGPGLTPCDALAIVLGPLAERFDPALRAALVRAVGLYPPGQVVRLDDGALARALAPDPADPARPLLERLTGADGRVLPESRRTIAALPPGRRIAAALPLAEWPVPPDAEAEAA